MKINRFLLEKDAKFYFFLKIDIYSKRTFNFLSFDTLFVNIG